MGGVEVLREGGNGGAASTATLPVHAPVMEVPSEASKKTNTELFEVIRNQNATIENCLAALIAHQDTAKRTNHVINPGLDPQSDSNDATTLRDITENPPTSDWARHVCEVNDKLWIARQMDTILSRKKNREPSAWPELPGWDRYCSLLRSNQRLRVGNLFRTAGDIWNPATASAGTEWVPIGISSELIDVYRLMPDLVAAFPSIVIPQGMDTLRIPALATEQAVAIVSPPSGAATFPQWEGSGTISTPTTAFLTLDSIKHGTNRSAIVMEEVEDATVAVVQAMVSEHRMALASAWESAILNGQTLNLATLDTANGPAAANGYGNGLRMYSHVTNIVETDAGGTTLSLATWGTAWSKMGLFGVKTGQVISVLGARAFIELSRDTNVQRVDSIGLLLATLPRGTVASVHGVPIIPTDRIANNLGADGDATTTGTTTAGLIVNRTRWRVGVKRNIEVKVFDLPGDDSVGIRGFARHAIGNAPPVTDKHTSYIFNIPA